MATFSGCVLSPDDEAAWLGSPAPTSEEPLYADKAFEGWRGDPSWARDPVCDERRAPFCYDPARFPGESAERPFRTSSFVVRLNGTYRGHPWTLCHTNAWGRLLGAQLKRILEDRADAWGCETVGDIRFFVNAQGHADKWDSEAQPEAGGSDFVPAGVEDFADTSAEDGRYYVFSDGEHRRLPRYDRARYLFRWGDIDDELQTAYNAGDGCFSEE